MKTKLLFVLLSAITISSIVLMGFGFRTNEINKNKKEVIPVTAGTMLCRPVADVANPQPFVPQSAPPPAVMVRKNIYSLSAAEINAIKAGVTAMKALPVTDPTSWQYQAAIHGTTLSNNLPSWNSCQHGTLFFLSWHRMYLYYFERILRAKSGSASLTLPYWDYQTNPVIPPAYRDNTSTLYNSTRNASMNSGGSLSSGIMTSIVNSLANIPYYDFQSDLEGPHGSVHVAIGGDMGAVNKAAKDPVFWLHHTNIDRLWEVWLRKCGGRSNPSDAAWLNQSFTFFDETGTAVSMTGSQVVKTAANLNYKYDFPTISLCNLVIDWSKYKWYRKHLFAVGAVRFNSKISRIALTSAKTDSLDKMVRMENKTKLFKAATPDKPSDRLMLEFENVEITKMPEGAVEIYLNLKPNEVPTPSSKSFVGMLDLFTANAHQIHKMKNVISLDVTRTANALGLSIEDLKTAQVSYYVRGNVVNRKELDTRADIKIPSMKFVLLQAAQQ